MDSWHRTGPGSGKWRLVSLQNWSLIDFLLSSDSAKQVRCEASVRGGPVCRSIKMFIDVTHKTLLFYYLDWKMVTYLTALLPSSWGFLQDAFSLTQIQESVFWWVRLPSFSFILHSFTLYFPHSCPSFCTLALTRLSLLAHVGSVKPNCTVGAGVGRIYFLNAKCFYKLPFRR